MTVKSTLEFSSGFPLTLAPHFLTFVSRSTRPDPDMNHPHRSCSVVTWLLFALLVLPAAATGQLLNARFISSVYVWEKYDTVDVSETFGRGYQSVLLDLSQDRFSIHTHLQGAINLQSQLDETPDFRAWYLYGRVRDIVGVVDVSFGRLPYFVGVGGGTLDGLFTTTRLAGGEVRLTLYGGAPASPTLALDDWHPLKNNYVVGGQIVNTSLTPLRLGLSYMNRRREVPSYTGIRPDSLFNPITVDVAPGAEREHYAGLDASTRFGIVRLYGRVDYDIENSKGQRAQAGVRFDPDERWVLSGEYIYRSPRIPWGSYFAIFPASSIHEAEAGVDYRFTSALNAFVRGALVQYDGDESFRYTVGVGHQYVSATLRGNTGYAGELTSLSLAGAYPLLDRMLIPNASVSFVSYRLSDAAPQEDALAVSLGATLRPIQAASLDVQAQWLRNRVFDNDMRLFAKLNIWLTEQLNLFN